MDTGSSAAAPATSARSYAVFIDKTNDSIENSTETKQLLSLHRTARTGETENDRFFAMTELVSMGEETAETYGPLMLEIAQMTTFPERKWWITNRLWELGGSLQGNTGAALQASVRPLIREAACDPSNENYAAAIGLLRGSADIEDHQFLVDFELQPSNTQTVVARGLSSASGNLQKHCSEVD